MLGTRWTQICLMNSVLWNLCSVQWKLIYKRLRRERMWDATDVFSNERERERVSWYVWSAKPHARTSRSTKALTNWRAIARQSTRAPGQTRGSWYFWCVKPMLSKKEKVFQFDFWRVARDYWIESLGKAVRLQRKLQRHRKLVVKGHHLLLA